VLAAAQHEKALNSIVFPGLQGGPLMHVIAAKAVAFKEALQPEFKTYQDGVVARRIQERSLDFITQIMRFPWRNGRNPGDQPQACDSEPRRRWRLRSVDLQRTVPEVAGQ